MVKILTNLNRMKKLSLLTLLCLVGMSAMSRKITKVSQLSGDLSEITEINFSNKGISEFPEKILLCSNLEILDLTNNGFVNMPDGLSKMEHLKVLRLSENPNMSLIDFERLIDSADFKLKVLEVSDCGLLYLPESIGNHKNLVKADFSNNYLKILPHSMMNFTELTDINLSNNDLLDVRWFLNYWWALRNIDLSGNEKLEVRGALYNLCYFDHLNTVTLSHLNSMPPEFTMFSAKHLVLKYSTIKDFPRDKKSEKIDKLTFENCKFKNEKDIVKAINAYAKPTTVSFKMMEQRKLVPFLALQTDSLDLRFNKLNDVSGLIKMKKLSWVDLRGNEISDQSMSLLAQARPDMDIMYKEKVIPNIGVAPPIAKYDPPKMKTTIKADKAQQISVGTTVFDLPDNAFLTADGKVYKGEVKVEYREFNNPVQTFMAGISMTSTEDGETMMFSSGGMFSIEAKDDKGNNLKVNPNSPIGVQMPSAKKTDMNLWRMNSDGVWEKKGKDAVNERFKLDETKLDSIRNLDYLNLTQRKITFTRDRYIPILSKRDKKGGFTITFDKYLTIPKADKVTITEGEIEVKNDEHTSDFLTHQTLYFEGDSTQYYYDQIQRIETYCKEKYLTLLKGDDKDHPLYTKEGPNFISELRLIKDFENDGFILNFSFKDSVVNIPVGSKTYSDDPKEMMSTTSKFYKGYQKAERNYAKEVVKNFYSFSAEIKREGRMKMKAALAEEKRRQESLHERLTIANRQVNNTSIVRSFELTSFGLWNCDVRSRMTEPTPMDHVMVSTYGDNFDESKINKVMIIDHTRNGVVQFGDKKSAFFDKGAKNAIVVFFGGFSVGVFRSWINRSNKEQLEFMPVNTDKVTVGEFQEMLTP